MTEGHIEPLCGLLRIGGPYGSPYEWCVTVRYLSPSEVELLGALRAPTTGEWRKAVRVLREAGIVTFHFDRRKGGVARAHHVRIRRPSVQLDDERHKGDDKARQEQ